HGFDSEGHAGLQLQACSRAPVMQDLRFFMKALSDAVAAEFLDDAVPLGFGMLLDGRADVAQRGTGSDRLDAQPKAFVGCLAQSTRLYGRRADVKHPAGIAVKAVLDHRDVDIEDIAALQY